MKRTALCLCIFALSLSFRLGQAQQTGIELLRQCQAATKFGDSASQTDREILDGVHCIGYLSGMRDTLDVWNRANDAYNKGLAPFACVPTEATAQELAIVVVKYLNDHPSELHEPYYSLVYRSLRSAYPCKNGPLS